MKKYSIVSKGCIESKKIEDYIKSNIKLQLDENNPNIVFVIGGDGTILRALHQYSNIVDEITIFGIHTGHLGFLANYKQQDINLIVDYLNNNKEYNIESQSLLEYKLNNKEVGLALNEVTITSAPYMITLEVKIDNELLETFRGGGLCISTPSGSTGYNKSLGGTVIDHNINCFQITEIAGINSNSYKTLMNSLLLSGDRIVSIKGNNLFALFTNDNNSQRLENFDSLEIKLSNKKVKFAYIEDINFVKRVNKAFL